MKPHKNFEDRKAHLTDECIEKCCRIATQNTNADFYIRQSAKSDSRYVYLFTETTRYVVRISDHLPNVFYFDRQVIVTPSTKNRKVVATLKNAVKKLQTKRINYLFRMVAAA